MEAFQEAVTPVSIVFALDTSGSMRKATDDGQAGGARPSSNALRPDDPLALILFSDKVAVRARSDRRGADELEAIDRYEANGGTALYDAALRLDVAPEAASRAGASSC